MRHRYFVATPIIFPSLSKAPSLDSGAKTYDDTIRDSMDLGYVATRPRFTRGRRTWNVNVRNLYLEDVRALDDFQETITQRGANSFYFPNLIQNGSFEFPAVLDSEIVQGWSGVQSQGIAMQPCSTAFDGVMAMQFATEVGSLGAGQSATGVMASPISFPVFPGEVYQGVFQWLAVVTGLAGVSYDATANLSLILQMSDGSTVNVSPAASNPISGTSPATYTPVAQQFTIPAPGAGLFIAGASLALSMTLQNASTSATALSAPGSGNSLSACFDSVGLALIQPAPGRSVYGRMAGSNSLVRPVRFAPSKLPEFSDLGFGTGLKLYGTTFALEEV